MARLEIDMTELRDKIAALIDQNLPEDYDAGFQAADAIIAALPDLVEPLVWERSHFTSWVGDYHTRPAAYMVRCADEHGYKWITARPYGYSSSPDAAISAANAHHAAAVVAALTGAKT
jgi:hypothetical protein